MLDWISMGQPSYKNQLKNERFKLEINVSAGNRTSDLCFPTGRIRRLGHRNRCYVAFKVLAIKSTSKNKHIKLIIVRCVLEQTVRQNMHLLYKYRCLQNIAIYTQSYDQFDEYIFICMGSIELWGKKTTKNLKWKLLSSPRIESATPLFLTGRTKPLGQGNIYYVSFITLSKLWMWIIQGNAFLKLIVLCVFLSTIISNIYMCTRNSYFVWMSVRIPISP